MYWAVVIIFIQPTFYSFLFTSKKVLLIGMHFSFYNVHSCNWLPLYALFMSRYIHSSSMVRHVKKYLIGTCYIFKWRIFWLSSYKRNTHWCYRKIDDVPCKFFKSTNCIAMNVRTIQMKMLVISCWISVLFNDFFFSSTFTEIIRHYRKDKFVWTFF